MLMCKLSVYKQSLLRKGTDLILCASVSVLFNYISLFLLHSQFFFFFSEIPRAETEAVEPNSSLGKETVAPLNCSGIACTRKNHVLIINILYSENVVFFLEVINVGFLQC